MVAHAWQRDARRVKLDKAFVSTLSDDSLTAVLTRGIGKDMKPFKDKLTAQEIEAVVKHVRTLGAPKS